MLRYERKPAVAIYGRISIEADEIRRRLENKLRISVAQLIERSLAALERELERAEQPAE
jgi:hypothetical protein